ncbi:hypothetical protein Ahy_A09g045037 [Arachis hypogaea]|uniref:Uncharacterized protein n=1 Tax=Arachis hypogaea TaxID=3818 RepID=A0A445BLD2_ARAHY|nr:hypothetical protein Ahy_A09g045037 [Arachis hypogaea]
MEVVDLKCEAAATTVGFEQSSMVHNSSHTSEANDSGTLNPDKEDNNLVTVFSFSFKTPTQNTHRRSHDSRDVSGLHKLNVAYHKKISVIEVDPLQ